MAHFRAVAFAAAIIGGAFCAGSASAAPAAPLGLALPSAGLEQVQWQHPNHRHMRHGPRRCWWENRRVRDHRGRWVVRRVQVCTR